VSASSNIKLVCQRVLLITSLQHLAIAVGISVVYISAF